jgi:hypothetical protein
MRHKTWFGTKGHETWIPTPAIDPSYSRAGYLSNVPGLLGGATIDASKNAHMVYALTWNKGARDDLRTIQDFSDGVFDTHPGPNLMYWVDPVAADRNVLPQHWATPALATDDAPSLLIDKQPTAVPTGANAWGLPARSATYTRVNADKTRQLYLPIPPGYVLWAGAVGDSASGGQVVIRDVNGENDTATTRTLTRLPGSDGVFVNLSLPRVEGTRTGVQFEIAVGTAATFTLTALTALLLPVGATPRVGAKWASGQGHSGCQFAARPAQVPHSAALDKTAFTATLEETGAYL